MGFPSNYENTSDTGTTPYHLYIIIYFNFTSELGVLDEQFYKKLSTSYEQVINNRARFIFPGFLFKFCPSFGVKIW